MHMYQIPNTDLKVSRLGYGCMMIGGGWGEAPPTAAEQHAAIEVVLAAVESGFTLFDHADIYARGKSEAVFAELWRQRPGIRDQIVVQSKCGIRFAGDPEAGVPARYDFSYEHIIRSVEGSLRRLETEWLDILLLHRPDPLVEPEEVARAFDELHRSGKVRYFGVSNHDGAQIELLRRWVRQPLVVNQLEINLLHHHLISAGILVNQNTGDHARASGTLDYCRLHDILVQAWSPIAGGALFNPPDEAPPHVQETAALVAQLAAAKETTPDAIVLAWLLRHPAPIQPIIGTTRPERVRRSALADEVVLTREEWYGLLAAARGAPVP